MAEILGSIRKFFRWHRGVHKGRYKYDVKVTIAGGNVSSTANYVRPVNGNASVYKTEINMEPVSVSAVLQSA